MGYMTPELVQRKNEVQAVLEKVVAWANTQSDIEGVAFVGSWARDEGRMDSDVDLLVLTKDPEKYIANDKWLSFLENPPVIRREQWGPVTERRVKLTSELEVEFGYAKRQWASISPLDTGTLRVVTDGMRVLYDPQGILDKLSTAATMTGIESGD